MKDKVLQLIENEIALAGGNAGAARLQLSYLDADQLDVQVGDSGKTLREQLVGYEQSLQEARDMKAWFLGVVG